MPSFRQAQGNPCRLPRHEQWVGLMTFVWLIYLVFPIVDLLRLPLSAAQRAAGVAGMAAFVALYAQVQRARWPYNGLFVALEVLMGFGLTQWVAPSYTAFFVYAAAASMWLGTPRRRAAGFLLALTGLGTCVVTGGVNGETAFSLAIVILVLGLTGFFIDRFRQVEAQLSAEQAERTRMAERERIARDLHDVLGHTLSLIVLKSQLAARLAREDPQRAAAECADLEAAARAALSKVRAVVAGFRGQPLSEVLDEAQRLCGAAGIELERSPLPELPTAMEGIFGLILREAVTNVVRHSGARRCRVTFAADSDGIGLTVIDDGEGFPESPAPAGGSGLQGMHERVAALGGRLEIATRPGGGTRLHAWLPKGDWAPESPVLAVGEPS